MTIPIVDSCRADQFSVDGDLVNGSRVTTSVAGPLLPVRGLANKCSPPTRWKPLVDPNCLTVPSSEAGWGLVSGRAARWRVAAEPHPSATRARPWSPEQADEHFRDHASD